MGGWTNVRPGRTSIIHESNDEYFCVHRRKFETQTFGNDKERGFTLNTDYKSYSSEYYKREIGSPTPPYSLSTRGKICRLFDNKGDYRSSFKGFYFMKVH